MKKALTIALSLVLVFSFCFSDNAVSAKTNDKAPSIEDSLGIDRTDINYEELDDPQMLRFVEDAVYADLVKQLDSEEFFVENVEAKYVSKEALEEGEYNSKDNVYFGYTLADLDEEFKGKKYIFTLGDDGKTVVEEFKGYDDSYEQMVKNVAVGAGVIFVCVTVTTLTAGTGTPTTVSLIFAASSKSATTFALSSGVFSGVSSGIVTGIKTKDPKKAIKAAALNGSKGFKWGAITGAFAGGMGEAYQIGKAESTLKGFDLNGLTSKEAALIQRDSKYPPDVIKQFKSMDEYMVYKNAGLKAEIVNGKTALVREIDLDYVSELGGKKVTNLERMINGNAPIDTVTGKPFQLHHIGQKSDATLAVLNGTEHQGNSAILNIAGKASEIERPSFAGERKQFWEAFAAMASK